MVYKGPVARKNKAEDAFEKFMYAEGWSVTKRGWPDFLAFKTEGKGEKKKHQVILVEVKADGSHPLKPEQYRVFQILASAGFLCYRYDPENGLNLYKPGQSRRKAGLG